MADWLLAIHKTHFRTKIMSKQTNAACLTLVCQAQLGIATWDGSKKHQSEHEAFVLTAMVKFWTQSSVQKVDAANGALSAWTAPNLCNGSPTLTSNCKNRNHQSPLCPVSKCFWRGSKTNVPTQNQRASSCELGGGLVLSYYTMFLFYRGGHNPTCLLHSMVLEK